MAVQIGARPDAGFENPLGMLTDCHRRIERFLGVLCVVVQRQGDAMTDEECSAIQAALHYFRTSGQRHNQDEEESLFPRLQRAAAGADLEAISHLEHDHAKAGELHLAADQLYSCWMDSGHLTAEERQRLVDVTESLRILYTEHIQTEEKTIFPRAAALLSAQAIAEMGAEFRNRRNQPQH